MVAGAVTGFLHTVFEIPAILAGILTQIGLWSINLRIMGGKSNVPLLKTDTIFSRIIGWTGINKQVAWPPWEIGVCDRDDRLSVLVLWYGDRERHACDRQ